MRQFISTSRLNIHLAKNEFIHILFIICLWIIMSVIVNPLGNFPLNDDWVYARAVESIVEKGNFTLSGGNTSANLIAQAYWGALFCLPFGFSFSALRISTLTLGLIGVVATYGLLRKVGASSLISFFGALLIALNPIYFGLSNTFMTDIPFFTLAVMSLYFLISGLKYNHRNEIIWGIFISYLSLLVRQNGIVIPLAFGCAYLVKKGLDKVNIIIAFIPTLLAITLQLAYQTWLESTNRNSPNFNLQARGLSAIIHNSDIQTIIQLLLINSSKALVYIGLFTAPLIIPIFIKKFQASHLWKRRLIIFAISILFILMMTAIIKRSVYMPFGGNILMRFGLGPLTLHDTDILNINYPFTSNFLEYAWMVLTVIAVFSAAILIYYLFDTIKQIFSKYTSPNSPNLKWLNTFIIVSIILYFLPLGIYGYIDRYLLILIPLLMVASLISQPIIIQLNLIRFKLIALVVIVVLAYGGFTIGVTHDYLSWNRVRWQALNNLLYDFKVLPNYIDGGYEFNGWYLYNRHNIYAINFQKNPQKPNQSWWYVDKDDYMIAFGPLAGYKELMRYPTGRWLPFGPESIFVLRKKPA